LTVSEKKSGCTHSTPHTNRNIML